MANVLRFDVGTLDVGRRTWIGGNGSAQELSPLECDLLAYLSDRAGITVPRSELLQSVWGYAEGVKSRAVDHTVRRLRTKLDVQGQESPIRSVYGGGYRFDAVRLQVEPPTAPEPEAGLIGRSEDTRVLQAALDAHRWVTLWGPGGVGKTSLSRLCLAERGGTWVDLSQASGPADVVAATALALGVPMAADLKTSADRVAAALDARAGLVVLDNCEQLDEACPELIAGWSAVAPKAVFLATSRRPLGAEGEHVVQLRPLDLDDALRLMVRAVRRVFPGFDVAPRRERWLDVVRLLDGLPLAVLLCAPRAGSMPPETLLERLSRSLGLVRRRVDAQTPQRHAALDRSLEWSWTLSDADLQGALVALAQIPGSFDLDQAEAVVGRPDALDLVDDLVRASWMHRPTEGGLALFRSVQTFVSERADPELAAAAEDRRRGWLLETAGDRDLRWRLRQVPALERGVWRALDRSPDQALELVRLLYPVDTQIPTDRLLALHDAVLEGVDPTRPEALEVRMNRVERVRARIGPSPDLEQELSAVLAEAQRQGQASADLRARCMLGDLAGRRGEVDRARTLLEAVTDDAREAGLHDHLGRALNALGLLAFHNGRPEDARRHYQDALVSYRLTGDRLGEVRCLSNLGNTLRRLDRFSEALATFQSALDLLDEGMVLDRGVITTNLAVLWLVQDQPEPARPLLLEALSAFEQVGATGRLALGLATMALCDLATGRLSEGETRALEAVQRARQADDPRAQARSLGIAAVAAIGQRDVDRGVERLDQARALYRDNGIGDGLVSTGRIEAVVRAFRGQPFEIPEPLDAGDPVIALAQAMTTDDPRQALVDRGQLEDVTNDVTARVLSGLLE